MNIYQTINEIVQKNMQLSGFLQGLGIDTCCGGQKTLAEACAELGLDPEDVLKQLIAPEPEGSKESSAKPQAERDWSQSTLSELIDHIETTHHLYVKKALPHLTDLMTRVVGAHGERHPEVLQLDELVRRIVADMGPHLMKEEQILFPAMKKMDVSLESFHCGSIQSPIRVMKADHDNLENLFSEIRKQTRDFTLPEDACKTWHALYEGLKQLGKDTHLHVHKENNILFPMAIEAEKRVE